MRGANAGDDGINVTIGIRGQMVANLVKACLTFAAPTVLGTPFNSFLA